MYCKNPGAWRLFLNYINGEPWYCVGRQRDMDEPLHSGNIEYRGEYTKDKNKAEVLKDKLLRGEED